LPSSEVGNGEMGTGAVLGKNIWGGLAPHHLGGNNEQNYRAGA